MYFRKALLLLALVTLWVGSADSQTSPSFVTGQVPTAAQWNGYFAGKMDYNSSGVPISGLATIPGNTVLMNPSSATGRPTAEALDSQSFGASGGTLFGGGAINAAGKGALCDGAHDDAVAINAAITSLAGGVGHVVLPSGTCVVGASIVLPTNVFLEGAGPGCATVIQAKAASTMAVVATTNFSSLTGSNTPAGPFKFGMRNLCIDGNKTNRGSGDGVDIYGYGYTIENVRVYNSPGTCFYSEWATAAGAPTNSVPANDFMEAHISNLKTFGCGSAGLNFLGPHDSVITNFETYVNAGVGAAFITSATASAAGVQISQMHSYGNSYGVAITALIWCQTCVSESNTSGGYSIQSGGGIVGSNISAYSNTGPGFIVDGSGSVISGWSSNNNTTDGIDITGTNNQFSNGSVFNNGGSGVVLGSSASGLTFNGLRSYSNAGIGLYDASSDLIVQAAQIFSNGAGGAQIVAGVSGIRFDGKLYNNTGLQIALGAPATGCMFDLVLQTSTGQTDRTGTLGNSFYRISVTGTGTNNGPVNQGQT